jgi:cytidine deaminase
MAISEKERHDLIAAARRAAGSAYCPYSRFRVGAAILTDQGAIVSGANVENASYGLTLCAERNAVGAGVLSEGATFRIRAVAIYTPTHEPTTPCGACRQVLNEFGPEAVVICLCDGEETVEVVLTNLLPCSFGPLNLEKTVKQVTQIEP